MSENGLDHKEKKEKERKKKEKKQQPLTEKGASFFFGGSTLAPDMLTATLPKGAKIRENPKNHISMI
jgi:hypothetical protein